MKFAIAIGILTASAAAASVTTASTAAVLAADATRSQRKQQQQDHVLSILKSNKKQQRGGGGLLRNNKVKRAALLKNRKSVAEPIECDPAVSSEDPDVGILTCGIGEYSCLESATSKLGGMCVLEDQEERQLQYGNSFITYYCDASGNDDRYGRPFLDCDCEDFDIDSGNGTITCTDPETNCFGEYYPTPECTDLCAEFTTSYDFELNEVIGYTQCYNIVTPYVQNLCVTYGAFEEYSYREATSCSIKVDDTLCNSCEMVQTTTEECFGGAGLHCFNRTYYDGRETAFVDGCYKTEEYCFNWTQSCNSFDCTNTDIGSSSGSGCDDYFLPAIEACLNSTDSLFTFPPSGTVPPEDEDEEQDENEEQGGEGQNDDEEEEATATSVPVMAPVVAAVAADTTTSLPLPDPIPAPSISPSPESA